MASKELYVVFPCDLESWAELKQALGTLKSMRSPTDIDDLVKHLEVIHKKVNPTSFPPQYENLILRKCVFYGVKKFLDNEASEDEKCRFFESTLPFIIDTAIDIEPRKPKDGLKYSLQQIAATTVLSRSFVSSVLACAFLCLFPRRPKEIEAHMNGINFASFFHYLPSTPQSGKLRCVLHYFNRLIALKSPVTGTISFTRQVLPKNRSITSKILLDCDKQLCPVYVDGYGKIEDAGPQTIQVDFANSYIGGGVVGAGRVQEEIRFCLSPELMAAMLFMTCMEDNEAIVIQGFEDYSLYSGYCDCFRFAGNNAEESKTDGDGNLLTCICAIDALPYIWGGKEMQYSDANILREINKAFIGFSIPLPTREPGKCLTTRRCGESESSDEFYSATESVDDEGVPDTEGEAGKGKVRTPISSSSTSKLLLTPNTTSPVSPLSDIADNKTYSPNLLEMEKMHAADTSLRRGSGTSDNSCSSGNSRRSSSRHSSDFSDFDTWASNFRRRSSNLSDASSVSRHSSVSSSRYSSDFSSEFEEYYESFQRQEHRRIQHESIREESAVPVVTDFANSLISEAFEEGSFADSDPGVKQFVVCQPTAVAKPEAVKVTHVGQSRFLPPLTDTQKYYGRDNSDGSDENSPTEEFKFGVSTQDGSGSSVSTVTHSPYCPGSHDDAAREGMPCRSRLMTGDATCTIKHDYFGQSSTDNGASQYFLPLGGASSHLAIPAISITEPHTGSRKDDDSDIDLDTPLNIEVDDFARDLSSSVVTDLVGNIMYCTNRAVLPMAAADDAFSVADRIVGKVFDDLKAEFRQSIPDSLKLEEKTLTPSIVVSEHNVLPQIDSFVEEFVRDIIRESTCQFYNECKKSAGKCCILTSRYSKMTSEYVSLKEIFQSMEEKSRNRSLCKVCKSTDQLIDTAFKSAYSSMGFESSCSACGRDSVASWSSSTSSSNYLDVRWTTTTSSSSSPASSVHGAAVPRRRKKRKKSHSLCDYADDDNSIDDVKVVRRNSAGGFVDPILSRFAVELQHSHPNSPTLCLYENSKRDFSSRRASADSDKREMCLSHSFEAELCNTPELDIDPIALFAAGQKCAESWSPSLFPYNNGHRAKISYSVRHKSKSTKVKLEKYANCLSKRIVRDCFRTLHSNNLRVSCHHEHHRAKLVNYVSNLVDGVFFDVVDEIYAGKVESFSDAVDFPFRELNNFASRMAEDVLQETVHNLTGAFLSADTAKKRLFQNVIITDHIETWPIATGNWGCGVFGGDAQLKAIIQWVSATVVEAPAMIYYTFQDSRVDKFPDVVRLIHSKRWTVRNVMERVFSYGKLAHKEHSERGLITTDLFVYLLGEKHSSM